MLESTSENNVQNFLNHSMLEYAWNPEKSDGFVIVLFLLVVAVAEIVGGRFAVTLYSGRAEHVVLNSDVQTRKGPPVVSVDIQRGVGVHPRQFANLLFSEP